MHVPYDLDERDAPSVRRGAGGRGVTCRAGEDRVRQPEWWSSMRTHTCTHTHTCTLLFIKRTVTAARACTCTGFTHAWLWSKPFKYMNSFNPLNSPGEVELLLPHLSDGEAEAQKGEGAEWAPGHH